MTKLEQRSKELRAASKDVAQRRKALIDEYTKTHKLPSRGRIITPELLALDREEARRFHEIMAKYKE